MTDHSRRMWGTSDTSRGDTSNDTAEHSSRDTSHNTQPSSIPHSPDRKSPAPQSLPQRLQASATGLARSAFQPSNLASDLTQFITNATNEKTTDQSSSTASTHSHVSSEISAPTRGPATQTQQGLSHPTDGKSFRRAISASTQGGFTLPQLTPDEFVQPHMNLHFPPPLDSIDANIAVNEAYRTTTPNHDSRTANPSLDPNLQGRTGNWKGKQRAHDLVQQEYTSAWERASHERPRAWGTEATLYRLDPTDGAAVISLLADPCFDTTFGQGGPGVEEEDLATDLAAAAPPLTRAEVQMLESFRKQIGVSTGDEQRQRETHQVHLSSRSLVPDIDTFPKQHDATAYTASVQSDGTRGTNAYAETKSLRDAVLSNLPGGADWICVQERYHDEVWGYLRPALEAAKTEIDEGERSGQDGGEDGPAVRRLKMILKHMRD